VLGVAAECGELASTTSPTDGGPSEAAPLDGSADEAAAPSDAGLVVPSCSPCVGATVVTSPGITSFAIDATNVYWTNATAVSKCPLSGCTEPTVLAFQPNAGAVHVADGVVYWRSVGGIARCGTTCTNDETTFFTSTVPAISAFDVAAGRAFIALHDNDGGILTCAANDCSDAGMFAAFQPNPWSVVADDASVAWLDRGMEINPHKAIFYLDASVRECDVGGCEAGAGFVSAGSTPTGLAMNASSVFWADGHTLYGCARSGVRRSAERGRDVRERAAARGRRRRRQRIRPRRRRPERHHLARHPNAARRVARAVALTHEQSGGPLTLALDATDVYWVGAQGTAIVATPK